MKRLIYHPFGLCLILWGTLISSARAIPGESVANVEAWIQAHPTLRPGPTERLVVNRADTPARRFTFRATIFPVAGLASDELNSRETIRTEQIMLVNTVDGVTANQLEESLRVIYDAMLYNDFRRARVLYTYPDRGEVTNGNTLLQGELREGDRYGYWIELTGPPDGFAYNGTITVFLKEDLSSLQSKLENR